MTPSNPSWGYKEFEKHLYSYDWYPWAPLGCQILPWISAAQRPWLNAIWSLRVQRRSVACQIPWWQINITFVPSPVPIALTSNRLIGSKKFRRRPLRSLPNSQPECSSLPEKICYYMAKSVIPGSFMMIIGAGTWTNLLFLSLEERTLKMNNMRREVFLTWTSIH